MCSPMRLVTAPCVWRVHIAVLFTQDPKFVMINRLHDDGKTLKRPSDAG
jgi:hypothetical protein